MIYIRMIRRKLENGGRFRTRNITFDRAGIDKLVCHADSIERVTMVATPSPPLSNFIRIILKSLFVSMSYCAAGKEYFWT